jgi:hypothetical protein
LIPSKSVKKHRISVGTDLRGEPRKLLPEVGDDFGSNARCAAWILLHSHAAFQSHAAFLIRTRSSIVCNIVQDYFRLKKWSL